MTSPWLISGFSGTLIMVCMFGLMDRKMRLRDRQKRELILLEDAMFSRVILTPREINACLDGRTTLTEIRIARTADSYKGWNTSCYFFTGNSLLFCAVNPDGGCATCDHSKPKA